MRFRAPISTVIAILIGLVVLLGYFIPALEEARQFLLQVAITLAAVALFVGVYNLVSVHAAKLRKGDLQSAYSVVLIASLVITFFLVLVLGPSAAPSRWVFANIQAPVEASLMAVLAVSLAYASVRLLRRRTGALSVIFVLTVLVILLGTGPLPGTQIPGVGGLLRDIRAWIAQVPAAAGARGILLGVALGTIATGLRILMGADRPYGG